MSRRNRSAFTLIELLIVVAIIAILAMIAVPNFLEAQTRAKVARVNNDLRSLAVAEEAYQVDWNSYTHMNTGTDSPEAFRGRWAGLAELTTPVAYLTSIPRDPFGTSYYLSGGVRTYHYATYEIGTGAIGVGGSGRPYETGYNGMPSDVFEAESDGPDHFDDTIGNRPYDPSSCPFTTTLFPWPTVNASDPANVSKICALCYDPTNGTVSIGEIYRVGGLKPSGQMWDVFWMNGSK